jgi:endonuclease/exonuclease/phosphatase family metal-dependent hydrolase
MEKRTIKIVSLNLWRFNDWDKRFPSIVSLLKNIDPDIILTQETQRDISFSDKNQLELLNEALQLPYSFYGLADIRTTRKGIPLPHPIENGLGMLSKFPFTSEIIPLEKKDEAKEKRILLKNDISIDGKVVTITNIHFTNTDEAAEADLKETLNIYKNRQIKGILAGDFNIKNLSQFKEIYDSEFISSADLFQYISYPEDHVSYDYILIPKEYSFVEFECSKEIVSDHCLLLSKISII